MAATAGTAVFLVGKRTEIKDLYLDDVAGARVNWDDGAGAGATTSESMDLPQGGVLVDLSVITGAAQTRLQLTRNGVPTGDVLRHVIQVDTSVGRPKLSIPFGPGQKAAIIQLA